MKTSVLMEEIMLIVYFLPAFAWGLMPIIAALTKAKPINQLLGTTCMALLFGSVFFLILKPEMTVTTFLVASVSGGCWSIGQYLQFKSFQTLPVSEAMPISNGTQLIGTTLVAVLFFKEWYTLAMVTTGCFGIVLIILGIVCTSYAETEQKNKQKKYLVKRNAVRTLLISSAALTLYVTIPRAFDVSGASVIFPQALGMWLSSIIIAGRNRTDLNKKAIRDNLFTGLLWSTANVSLFLSMPVLGVAKGFTFSQFAVLLSIFGGIIILKVKKTPKELCFISLGAILLLIGVLMIGSLK